MVLRLSLGCLLETPAASGLRTDKWGVSEKLSIEMGTSTHLARCLFCHTIWIGCRDRNKDRHGEVRNWERKAKRGGRKGRENLRNETKLKSYFSG